MQHLDIDAQRIQMAEAQRHIVDLTRRLWRVQVPPGPL